MASVGWMFYAASDFSILVCILLHVSSSSMLFISAASFTHWPGLARMGSKEREGWGGWWDSIVLA